MIDGKGLEDLKIRFNELMISYWLHEKDALQVANYYHNTYLTKCKLWEYKKERQVAEEEATKKAKEMEEEEKEEKDKKKKKKGEKDDGSSRIIDVSESEW